MENQELLWNRICALEKRWNELKETVEK